MFVGVAGPDLTTVRCRRTLEGLSQVFEISLVEGPGPDPSALAGLIAFGEPPAWFQTAPFNRLPQLWLVPAAANGGHPSAAFRFASHPCLPPGLRGQVWGGARAFGGALSLAADKEEPLGWLGSGLVWARSNGPQPARYRAMVPFSAFEGEAMAESLSAESDRVPFVPWVHFLKELAGNEGWRSPGLPACYIIDDPNLRAMRYGWLDYRELVRRARAAGYHASIATVPLDGSSTRAPVAQLFREARDSLSLCIHGNDHTRLELARHQGASAYRALGAQALCRVQLTESRYGVRFCRVMEAPHGVISQDAGVPLAGLGFEAAAFTPAQFLRGNRDRDWPPALGWRAKECLPGGLHLIPRILMSPRWQMEAGWAAWLGQAVVVAGHHWDLDEGLDFLDQMARLLSRWDGVRWGPLTQVAQAGYLSRQEGSVLRLRATSRGIRLTMPDMATALELERAWIEPGAEERLRITNEATGSLLLDEPRGRHSGSIDVTGGTRLIIASPPEPEVRPETVRPPPFRLWPRARRVICEARDRSTPWLKLPSSILGRPPANARSPGSVPHPGPGS